MRRAYRPSYSVPGKDSPRAIANATLFLSGARTIDGLTADELARRYALGLKRAEYLLTLAVQRRADAV